MQIIQQAKALYAAFDVYPSSKGASTHIYHFSETLFETIQPGLLYVLNSPKLPEYQQENEVEIIRFAEDIPNFLQRAQAYGLYLSNLLKEQRELKIAHFRDPWSGVPILLNQAKKNYVVVYEVNGLPSIELPYRYPKILTSTLKKIRDLEDYCLKKSDYILCPSQAIQQHLLTRGLAEDKIKVIPNGAVIPQTLARPLEAPEKYLIYFGALQKWQGLDILLKAFAYLQDFEDLYLVICSSHRERYGKVYKKLAERLGITERIIWKHQLSKKELYDWVAHAYVSLAPLIECSRNLEQGCCPLKILESMALATPAIAADIPAVREIISSSNLGKLVRPGRPSEWARAIRVLLEYPEHIQQLGENARNHIQKSFTWKQQRTKLKNFYEEISC